MTNDLIREGAIIMPLRGNDGADISKQRAAVIDAAVRHFGGATVTDGQGYWRDDAGKLIAEPVSVVSIAYVDCPQGDAIMREMAQAFTRDAGQTVTYLRYASGVVELVPAFTLETYTVWVQQSSGEGTMHVSAHVGKTPEEAAEHAITETLADWDWQDDPSHRGAVRVVGIAKGDVSLVEWND